jgi:hypothetical protein
MTEQNIKTAAYHAITRAKAKYGKGWEHVSEDAKVGTAVRIVVVDFASYSPNAPASDVAKVVQAAADMVAKGA